MKHENRWITERSLGRGGQGEVFLVREESQEDRKRVKELFERWPANGVVMYEDEREKRQAEAVDLLAKIVDVRSRPNFGALKVLHPVDKARDPVRSRERAAREIKAMRTYQHPNLLALKECDGDELWYVSEFHEGGPLDQVATSFQGNLLLTLRAVRQLVDGVALLHQNGVVHRDIKPHNIFLASDGRLILGDFGLIYVPDPEIERLSATHSNVGTHAWMPGWAMDHRVTELRPTFDVFSLGKVIWSMLSGRPNLTLWYYNKPANDVCAQFPDRPELKYANELLGKCVVENEEDCLASAEDLLKEIDRTIEVVSRGQSYFDTSKKICRICHLGEYAPVSAREQRNFGIDPGGTFQVLLHACTHCRHVELFYIDGANPPKVWQSVLAPNATLPSNRPEAGTARSI